MERNETRWNARDGGGRRWKAVEGGGSRQTPWPEHAARASAVGQLSSQLLPWRAGGQTHAPRTQTPPSPQPPSQLEREQSGPSQPSSHAQTVSWHVPWPLHARPATELLGQVGLWHHAPTYPAAHQQEPSMQRPRPEQPSRQERREQSGPERPWKHAHNACAETDEGRRRGGRRWRAVRAGGEDEG